MDSKQLRAIRKRMGLTQKALAGRLLIAENTVARMERDEQVITPPMGLLISYVAREAGVDPSHPETGSRKATDKKRADRGAPRHSGRKSRARPGDASVSPRRR